MRRETYLAYLAFRALLFGKPSPRTASPGNERATVLVVQKSPSPSPRQDDRLITDHLEHLRETKDLFGNLARSFATSEKLVKDETQLSP
jgi:hypothetical protein